jgi:hypothetical protein
MGLKKTLRLQIEGGDSSNSSRVRHNFPRVLSMSSLIEPAEK